MSNIYIRIEGPNRRRGHLGDWKYWNVGVFNEDNEEYFDLVPWNERGSLPRKEALRIAEYASKVMGFVIREFNPVVTALTDWKEVQ